MTTTAAWDTFFDSLDEEGKQEALSWVASRPPEIQTLCYRFPPGTLANIDGKIAWLVGYSETDENPGLLFSHINPYKDYDGAVESRFFVCGDHIPESSN